MYFITFLGILYFGLPVLIIHLCRKYVIFDRIGTVLLAYMVGLIIGNAGIIPSPSDAMETMLVQSDLTMEKVKQLISNGPLHQKDFLVFRIKQFQELMTIITVPIALPLLLFASDMKSWKNIAGKGFLSMLLALISVIIVVTSGHLLFLDTGIDEIWKVSGLMVGLYSGGTPNLASLKLMLEVKSETYILTHTYDTVVSAAYLFFLITIGKNVFKQMLPSFRIEEPVSAIAGGNDIMENHFLSTVLNRNHLKSTIKTLFYAVVIFGLAGLLSMLVDADFQMLVVILTITTLSIAVALTSKIKVSEHAFSMGMYFILVFSVVVASMADFSSFTATSTSLFYYVCYVIFISLLLHVLLSRIFRIDGDTVMVTSTALICSPPFVPMIAGAIKNREVIVSGITVGIIGYAIGNYLGVAMAYVLQSI